MFPDPGSVRLTYATPGQRTRWQQRDRQRPGLSLNPPGAVVLCRIGFGFSSAWT